jgi:hypothetical protein
VSAGQGDVLSYIADILDAHSCAALMSTCRAVRECALKRRWWQRRLLALGHEAGPTATAADFAARVRLDRAWRYKGYSFRRIGAVGVGGLTSLDWDRSRGLLATASGGGGVVACYRWREAFEEPVLLWQRGHGVALVAWADGRLFCSGTAGVHVYDADGGVLLERELEATDEDGDHHSIAVRGAKVAVRCWRRVLLLDAQTLTIECEWEYGILERAALFFDEESTLWCACLTLLLLRAEEPELILDVRVTGFSQKWAVARYRDVVCIAMEHMEVVFVQLNYDGPGTARTLGSPKRGVEFHSGVGANSQGFLVTSSKQGHCPFLIGEASVD